MLRTIDTCKLCGLNRQISEHTRKCDACWEVEHRLDQARVMAAHNREFALSLLRIVADSGVLADFRLVGDEPVVLAPVNVFNLNPGDTVDLVVTKVSE